MATRIYTKTGDQGETGLYGGRRVPKDHVRVEAYGTIDELNAALGQVRALAPPPVVGDVVARVQALLLELGGELATPPEHAKRPTGFGADDVSWLEQQIDAHEAELPALKGFILPSGTPLAAALQTARAVCRRAERRVVTLCHSEPATTPVAVVFINRLADLLFVLARRANALAGQGEEPWHPSPHD